MFCLSFILVRLRVLFALYFQSLICIYVLYVSDFHAPCLFTSRSVQPCPTASVAEAFRRLCSPYTVAGIPRFERAASSRTIAWWFLSVPGALTCVCSGAAL